MGFGGSSSSSTTSSPFATPLATFGAQEFRMAKPILSTLGSQFVEALRTGGVNSFIPWITRSLDSVRRASSTGIEQLRQSLARSGMAGSSIGQQQLSTAETAAGEQANLTPEQMIMSFIQGAPQFGLGLAGQGLGALGQGAGIDTTTKSSSQPGFWDTFMQGLQGGGQIAAAFAG